MAEMRSNNRERGVSFSMPNPIEPVKSVGTSYKALYLTLKELCLYEPIIVDNKYSFGF